MANASSAPLPAETPATPVSWAYRLQGWGAAACFAVFRMLPLDLASTIGGALARTVGPALGVSKRARLNLAAAMPDLPAAAIDRHVRAMWDNLGRVVAEYPHLRGIDVFAGNGRVETLGLEHVEAARAAGRRLILFSGHLANWEIAALAAGQYGLDVAQIYRAANNPLIDRMIRRLRGAHGELIPKGAVASRRVFAALRRGGHVSLLVDQKLNDGIPVPFFGRAAMTAPALALLALRFDCAVLPCRVERLAGAHFRLTVEPPLPLPRSGDRDSDVAALMTTVNAVLERWIRERPGQWFWLHRRWPD